MRRGTSVPAPLARAVRSPCGVAASRPRTLGRWVAALGAPTGRQGPSVDRFLIPWAPACLGFVSNSRPPPCMIPSFTRARALLSCLPDRRCTV